MRKELIDHPIRIFQWEGLWQPSRRLQWQKVGCTQKCQCRQKKARNAAGYQATGQRARAVNQSGATGGPRDELKGQQKLSGESTRGWEFKRQYSMNLENTKVMSLCSSRAGLSFPALLEVTFFFFFLTVHFPGAKWIEKRKTWNGSSRNHETHYHISIGLDRERLPLCFRERFRIQIAIV